MDFRLTYGELDLCDYPFALEFGADFGAPQNLTEALAFLLQDGEIELSDRASNRTIEFALLVEGTDQLALAEAEAALIAESEKPMNTLVMDPGDGYGAKSLYETFRGQVAFARDDNFELAGYRRYSVTMRAYPFVKSADEVVAVAEKSGTTVDPPTVTEVTVFDGNSTSGWTGTYQHLNGSLAVVDSGNPTFTAPGGSLNAAAAASSPGLMFNTRIGIVANLAADVSTTKQLVVRWAWDQSAPGGPTATWRSVDFTCLVNEGTGSQQQLVRVEGTVSPPRSQYAEIVFTIPASLNALSSVRLTLSLNGQVSANGGQVDSLFIDSITRSNANLASGTPRQLIRSIDVKGSARTQGRIAIEHQTSALGDVLAYFCPDDGSDYAPPLRRWKTAGGSPVSASTNVSAVRENLVGNVFVADVPAQRVPRGRYLLVARVGGATTAARVSWDCRTMFGATDVGPLVSNARDVNLSGGYQMVPLGRVQLPTRDLDDETPALVRIRLAATVTTGTECFLDEAWIFNLSTGRLLQIPCGSGTPAVGGPANRCWIDPPTVSRPRPTVRIGTMVNRADARYAMDSVSSGWQFPEFKPPTTRVFTVTTDALDAAVTLTHAPRWHTHAAS